MVKKASRNRAAARKARVSDVSTCSSTGSVVANRRISGLVSDLAGLDKENDEHALVEQPATQIAHRVADGKKHQARATSGMVTLDRCASSRCNLCPCVSV